MSRGNAILNAQPKVESLKKFEKFRYAGGFLFPEYANCPRSAFHLGNLPILVG